MNDLEGALEKECRKFDPSDPTNEPNVLSVQLVLSLALGASAFLGFCVRSNMP